MKKRRIISLMLAGAMTASLAGCGGSGTAATTAAAKAAETTKAAEAAKETTKEAETARKEKIVIDVWSPDVSDTYYVEQMIEKFNSTNDKGIEIALTTISEDYGNMLSLAYTSGTAPDIAIMSAAITSVNVKAFVESGIILPLNDYIADPEFEKATEASTLRFEGVNAFDGNVYWVPTGMRSGSRIQYNKTLLEEAGYTEIPDTLEGVVELADKITKNGNGQYYGVAFPKSAPFVRWLESVGETSGIYRYDYTTGTFNFDGYKPLIETANKFFANESVLPGSTSQGVDAVRALFADGACGIWGNASQEAGVFTNQFPITKFEWGVAELPTLEGGERKGAESILPIKGYAMFASTEDKDAAWEVIKYFSSEEFVKGYLEEGLALPISKYMDSIVDKSGIGRLADFQLTDYESVYPAVPNVTLEGDNYQIVLWSAIMGEISADEAIADLNKRYNEALENDIKLGKIKRLVIKDYDPLHPSAGTVEYTD